MTNRWQAQKLDSTTRKTRPTRRRRKITSLHGLEVTTDSVGRWSINRIAPDMILRLYGSAQHPEYVGAPMIFVGQDREAEKQLREGASGSSWAGPSSFAARWWIR